MLGSAGDIDAVRPTAVPGAAFLFADIVGFTAFTEACGDSHAAQLAWRLRLGVERQLGHDAHVVKTLGDAVMVRIADPAEAAVAGARIVSRALPRANDPQVRVGIHHGPAVECDGDFFGAAVNVAARVAALAGPGEVLLTDALVLAAREHGLRKRGIALEPLGERTLRNVAGPVVLHAARERPQPPRARRAAHADGTTRARLRTPWPIVAGAELVNA
jgi:adenylate cyclase